MDRLDAVVRELRSTPEPSPEAVGEQPVVRTRPRRTRRGATRFPRRRLLLLLLPALLLLFAIARSPAEQTSHAPSPVVHRVDPWRAVLSAIDRHRMQAFIHDDVASLLAAEVKDSPAYVSDIAIMTDLRRRGLVLDHNPLRVLAITEEFVTLSGDVQRARLRVTDVLDAYVVKDEAGNVVETHPARGPRTWRLELARQRGRDWRLIRVTPEAVPQSPAPTTRP